jgi:hypothetical protein
MYYVGMYVFMNVCGYVCMYVCMWVCIYECIHVLMYVCMYECIMWVCMYVCMWVCMYVCMNLTLIALTDVCLTGLFCYNGLCRRVISSACLCVCVCRSLLSRTRYIKKCIELTFFRLIGVHYVRC